MTNLPELIEARSESTKYHTSDTHKNGISTTKRQFLLKKQSVSTTWIAFHIFALFSSVLLFVPIFVIPLTGAFLFYNIIIFGVSFDAVCTMFSCRHGVCCRVHHLKWSIVDDIVALMTTLTWILALFVAAVCGLCDVSSTFTTWNRWEDGLPVLLSVVILVLLCYKMYLRVFGRTLPLIYKENFLSYHQDLVDTASTTPSHIRMLYCTLLTKWILFLFFIVCAFTSSIHSVQKTSFISSFSQRNTAILSTADFGEFEYQCLGNVEPEQADVRFISIGGLSTTHLTFGWYNNFLYQEYGVKHSLNISICDYNRGGFGFTESKGYRDKTIESEVAHLMQIADALFGVNASVHLMGHSRAGTILVMAKMLYPQRVSSMVIFDGVNRANALPAEPDNLDETLFLSDSLSYRFTYQLYSIAMPVLTFAMTTDSVVNVAGIAKRENMYEADLSGEYYAFRNYLYQSAVWESKDLSQGYKNAVTLYRNGNYTIENWTVLDVECDENFDTDISYVDAERTLYAKSAHSPCVLDKDVAEMIFYYEFGVKTFYDRVFNF